MWYLYIILTEKGKLYTGITKDIARRFEEHQSGKGAKFFRSDRPIRIVYQEKKKSRSTASKREAAIKKLPRAKKVELIMDSGHKAASSRKVSREKNSFLISS